MQRRRFGDFSPRSGRRAGRRVGLALWVLGAAGCHSAAQVTPGSPRGLAEVPSPPGPPQLVCYADDGQLVVAAADGQHPVALRAQPPAELVALAVATGNLVGVSQGKVWSLLEGGTNAGRHWQQVARWDPAQWSAEPLRAASYGPSAVVWMRGNDPGTVPAALEVTAQGQVIKEAVQVVERSRGGIWQSSHAAIGPLDKSFPEALRLLVAQVRMSGQDAREQLLHSERSPWGGRLVAPNLGIELRGDWPDAPLFYIGASPDAPPVPLQYDGEPLFFRGLIGYGATAQLYVDGRFAKRGRGLLVVAPPGSPGQGNSKGRKPLEARLVKGLRPPCAVVNADWHE